MDKFVSKYKAKRHNKRRRVLLETSPHPSHILVFLYVAHILNTRHDADIYFIENADSYASEIYRRLGYISIPANDKNRTLQLISFSRFYIDKILKRFSGKTLLDVKIAKTFIGDLLIDTAIRYGSGKFDKEFSCEKYFGQIKNAYFHYYKNYLLIRKYKFTDAAISHMIYTYYGILPRLGIKEGMKSFVTNSGGIFKLENENDIYFSQFHAEGPILDKLMQIDKETLSGYLRRRFNGDEKLFAVDFPFNDTKRKVTREELVKELNLDPALPICTIYLHAFADANHYEQKMIYSSYFVWCIETINMVKSIKNVNWIIKDHPLAFLYDEEGFVPSLVAKYDFKYVPNDINSKSIMEISDSIVTIRGTIGLEAPLFNIKPILAGYSYYCNYGFTINCETEQEYYKALSSITFKTEVSEDKKDIAGRLLYWVADLIAPKSNIIEYAIHPENPEDTKKFFDYYIKKIEKIGGMENDILYKNLVQYFGEDKKTLTSLGVL